MAYVRFIPGFTRHPKRLQCSVSASWLWVSSVDYCCEMLTDGVINESVITTLCPGMRGSVRQRAIKELLAVGSWERVPNGYIVHDFLKHNSSKADVETERRQSRERYQRFIDKRNANAVTNALDNAAATHSQRSYLSVIPSSLHKSSLSEEREHVIHSDPTDEPDPAELEKIDAWLADHPYVPKTQEFVRKWLDRARRQPPATPKFHHQRYCECVPGQIDPNCQRLNTPMNGEPRP